MFSSLVGNSTNREILRRLVKRERFGATFIFAGPDGVGKRQFALAFAKTANCQNPTSETDSCDRCPSCFRIEQQAHPDVRILEPNEKGIIKVDAAREFAKEIRFRPYEGRQRFFLINESERFREEAANALLKTLEEPPPTSNIILLTARPDTLLPTVRSRSQQLSFAPLPLAEMEKYIAAQGRPKAEIALLARLSEGSIGQLSSIDLTDYRRERREVMEVAELLADDGSRYRLMKAAEYIGKQEKDLFEKKLDLLMKILRDIMLLASGKGRDEIINIDEAEKLDMLAKKIGWPRLRAWIEGFNELRFNLVVNINRQVAMDGLLQRLASGR